MSCSSCWAVLGSKIHFCINSMFYSKTKNWEMNLNKHNKGVNCIYRFKSHIENDNTNILQYYLNGQMSCFIVVTCCFCTLWDCSNLLLMSKKRKHKMQHKYCSDISLKYQTYSGFPPENLLSSVAGWPPASHVCFSF